MPYPGRSLSSSIPPAHRDGTLVTSPGGPIRGLLRLALVALVLGLGACADDETRVGEFMARGEAYVAEGLDEEAIIEFKNVLQIEPEHAGAHEALSQAYLRVEKPREAYWEMSETVRLDPDNVEARLRYGTISAAIGDYDLSLEQANAVLEREPENARAQTLRAQALENREDYEGAEAAYRAAVEAEPEAPAFHFLLGGFYERRGRLEAAEAAYRRLLDVEESYLAAAALTRVVLRDSERQDEAPGMLDRLIAIAAEAPREAQELAPGEKDTGTTSLAENTLREDALFGAYSLKAFWLNDRGDGEAAVATLEEGIERAEDKLRLIYQLARLHRVAGRIEEEDATIRRAADASPDNAEARIVLSVYLGQRGDLDGALEAAESAVAVDGKSVTAKLRLAELLVDVGFRDGDQAAIQRGRAIVDEILATAPESAEGNFVKAKIELAEGDVETAKTSLQTTLQTRPNWGQARFVLGSAYASTGDLSRARVELEAAVEAEPELADARKLLTQVYAQLGEHEFAIDQGRTYLRGRPGDTEIRIIVGQSLIRVGRANEAYDVVAAIPEDERNASALFALGRLDLAFGRIDEGAEKLRRAEALAPGNAQVLRSLVAIDRQRGQLDASDARIARALEARPEDSEVWELAGEFAGLRGEVEKARESFQRAIELEPRNVSAQLNLAELEMRTGNVEAMLAVIQGAADAVPESGDLQYRLAQALDRTGRRKDAMAAYERAITLDPQLAMAKNNLAYMIAEVGGDLDRALELAQQAKEQLPDDGNAADTLGWVLLKRGLPSAAIGYLEEAAERFPEEAYEIQGIVHNHLAAAYEANEERDKAVANAERTLRFYENLSEAARARGLEVSEPDWVKEARARVERLSAAS